MDPSPASQKGSAVKLIVKEASNQSCDQTIDCDTLWSIKKLKEHLSEIYPCKPRIDEQKLIYSGQLLTDKAILKDVLRHYEGEQPPAHIFHMVYSPKNKQIPVAKILKPVNSSGDGLRQRNVSENTAEVGGHNYGPQLTGNSTNNSPAVTVAGATVGQFCPTSGFNGSSPSIPPFMMSSHQASNEYAMAQQMAMQNWMQQAYIQYMNQYMSLMSVGVRPETVFMQNQVPINVAQSPQTTSPGSVSAASVSYGLPQMPFLSQENFDPNNLNPPQTAANAPQVATARPAEAQNQPRPVAVEPQQNPPQPRFPNIVQEELPENRDWLDIFYAMSRLMVLLTLIYFYSSPMRCLVVIFIGLAIYLYHIGFFRPQQLPTQEANNNNVAVNIAQAAAAQPAANNDAEPRELHANAENPTGTAHAAASDRNSADVSGTPQATEAQSLQNQRSQAAENDRTSVIDFIKTFVVSFFVSLLPEVADL